MTTRFGEIQISNSQPFSVHPNGFGISPYLQEKLVFLGQSEVYKQAGELACAFFGLPDLTSQIYRLTNHYGHAIAPELDLAPQPAPVAAEPVGGVVYGQADGAMLLTDEGYKEAKLGRIFLASALKKSVVDERGGHIESSLFVGHVGSSTDFSAKFEAQLSPYKALGENLVFVSDGSVWLRQMMVKICPKATLILDFYHAMEHIGKVGKAAFGDTKACTDWFSTQRKLLLDSRLDTLIENILDLKIDVSLRGSVCTYLASNRDRMDYKLYRERGLLIGSGAIESGHRTVMQKRLKRSGQRWSIKGAQCVLNLRVCLMSNRWKLLRNQIEPFNYAIDE
jgi:hypothetical protein